MKSSKTVTAIIIIILVLIGVVAAMLMTGKKSSDNSMQGMQSQTQTQSSKAKDTVATTTVDISNFAFSPTTISVKVGDTVTWTNKDSVHHTVTADNGAGPDSALLAQGVQYTFTFKKAGTYSYHCQPHPYMKGTVIVSE